jgi:hypothetical protein
MVTVTRHLRLACLLACIALLALPFIPNDSVTGIGVCSIFILIRIAEWLFYKERVTMRRSMHLRQMMDVTILLSCTFFLYEEGILPLSLILTLLSCELLRSTFGACTTRRHRPLMERTPMHLLALSLAPGIFFLFVTKLSDVHWPLTFLSSLAILRAILVVGIVLSIGLLIRQILWVCSRLFVGMSIGV